MDSSFFERNGVHVKFGDSIAVTSRQQILAAKGGYAAVWSGNEKKGFQSF